MTRNLRQSLPGAVLALFLISAAVAQSAKDAPPAPVPARILTAKTVFVANGGQDEQPTDNPAYNGARDRAYNQLYAALQTWGRYKLVSDPGEADLVLEIRFVVEWPSLGDNAGLARPRPGISAGHPRPENQRAALAVHRTRAVGDSAGQPRKELRSGAGQDCGRPAGAGRSG